MCRRLLLEPTGYMCQGWAIGFFPWTRGLWLATHRHNMVPPAWDDDSHYILGHFGTRILNPDPPCSHVYIPAWRSVTRLWDEE